MTGHPESVGLCVGSEHHDFRNVGVRYVDGTAVRGSSSRYRNYFRAYRCSACLAVHTDIIPDGGGRTGWTNETTLFDATPAGEDERRAVEGGSEQARRVAASRRFHDMRGEK